MNKPKVSIIIPVYNGSNYLADAIQSAINQTYENKEIIVVNDGSCDEGLTEEVALSFSNEISYYYKENGGVSSALNYGISKMTGEYFSWLSHDDLYSANKIEHAINLLGTKNQLGKKCVAFTSGHFIDLNNKKIGDFKVYFKENRLYSGYDVVDVMTKQGTLNGCCMLIPRAAFSEAGYFDETLRYSQDALMWYQIFLKGYSLVSDNKDNVMYRLHRNQTSQTRKDLYNHDACYIAEKLASPLLSMDKTGKLLIQYLIRLTRNNCLEAINYLLQYAKKNNLINFKYRIIIFWCIFKGFVRYNFALIAKKFLIKLRG